MEDRAEQPTPDRRTVLGLAQAFEDAQHGFPANSGNLPHLLAALRVSHLAVDQICRNWGSLAACWRAAEGDR